MITHRFNSTFKVGSRSLRGGKIRRVGKKGKDWIAVRRRLSAQYAAQGITRCELNYEGCWGEGALGFAHGRKRPTLEGQ